MVSFKVYYEANIANIDDLKGEIVDLLRHEGRTKPNLEPRGPIHRWFMNSFMKWATQPGKNYELEDKLGLEPHEYKEGEPEWMKKPDVMDFQGHGLVQLHSYWPKFSHVIDYFNSLSDRDREKIVKKPYDQVEKEVAAWDEQLGKAKVSETKLKEGTDYEVLSKDGDYTWVKLSTKEAYECEGAGMGHCVGGYDPESEHNTIISLWDKKGEPHVTIEVEHYGHGTNRPYGDIPSTEQIIQIKGKQNAAPAEKYKDITAKFVRDWLEDPAWNEDPEEPKRYVSGDGENIGMISYDNWRGGSGPGTYYFFPDSKLWENIYKTEVVPEQQHRIKSIKKAIHNEPGFGKYIDGKLNLSYMYLKEIPKELEVRGTTKSDKGWASDRGGDVNLQKNLLTSLKNSPREIDGDLYAGQNYIETLEGGPEVVTGDYKIAYNKLKNLKGIAKEIGGDLHIEGNPLESLDGAQDTVVLGKVFIGGWPYDPDDRGGHPRLEHDRVGPIHRAAPDFLKSDKVRAAFKTPQAGPTRSSGRMPVNYLPPREDY